MLIASPLLFLEILQPPRQIFLSMLSAYLAIFAVHLITRKLCHIGVLARRLFVIGDGSLIARLRDAMRDREEYVLVGAFSLDACDGDGRRRILEDIRQASPSEVVLALEERRGRIPFDLLFEIRKLGVRVIEYDDIFEEMTGRVDLDHIRPSQLIFEGSFEGSRIEEVAKRFFDIVVASTLLVLTLPVMLLASLAIYLDDGRPIFYRQARVGRFGVPFFLLKFRTMYRHAERDGPRFAGVNDQRVTRVGRLLRRFRIDELPQLFHVLTGDMSIVGPRPERPEFVQRFQELLPWFEQRHRVRPGLAGWAQLHAPYAADLETTRLKLAYDLYYLRHWSLALDLVILLRTFQVVVWGQGVR